MDPNQAYKEIMGEIADGNMGAAWDLFHELLVWVRKGGFPPSNTTWKENILIGLKGR